MHSVPNGWNPREMVNKLELKQEDGFCLTSDEVDQRGVPVRTVTVKHVDYESSGDHWEVTSIIRFGLFEKMELTLRLTTREVEGAFNLEGVSDRWSKYRRQGKYLAVPGNAGSFNISILISDEIFHKVQALLARYGSLTEIYKNGPAATNSGS